MRGDIYRCSDKRDDLKSFLKKLLGRYWSYVVTAMFKFLPGIIAATLSRYPRVQKQQREHCPGGIQRGLNQAELDGAATGMPWPAFRVPPTPVWDICMIHFLFMKWTRKWMLQRAKIKGGEVRGLLKITKIEAGGLCTNYPVDYICLPFNFSESCL